MPSLSNLRSMVADLFKKEEIVPMLLPTGERVLPNKPFPMIREFWKRSNYLPARPSPASRSGPLGTAR